MIRPTLDAGLVAATAAELDLRPPNRDALMTIAVRLAEHFAVETPALPYEGVIDVATGVGKTYVLAAAIDYLAAMGHRNFAIIAPGRTVARKTLANFTPGHPKSLLGGMQVDPVVITAETFSTAAVAAAIEDPDLVKIYIFTVQALIRPTTTMGRRTHEYDEDLGASFYERLREADDLVVLADEHHLYGGPAFDRAVRGLEPEILLGFTATPLPGSPVIFRYPLAAAIAERYVKTPVIDGRRDDLADALTKLTDGTRLLEAKAERVRQYREVTPDAPLINPVMLVMCPTKDDADEVEGILRHPGFAAGRYAGEDAVLKVYSDATDLDAQLEKLDNVEDADSPVRIIVAVGMLKEGWDVRNVYVICSLRASVSQILTEQTLGRGLRLPFGRYTGVELLDTLDIVAHERYEALIRQVDRVREKFIDFRTVIRAPTGDGGTATTAPPTTEQVPIEAPVAVGGPEGDATAAPEGGPVITTVDDRVEQAAAQVRDAPPPLYPRTDVPAIEIPIVAGQVVENPFSLNDITDLNVFRAEGRRIATTPPERLRRTVLAGRVIETEEGREAAFQRRVAATEVTSAADARPLEASIADVMDRISGAGVVPARQGERARLRAIVDLFVEGVGADARVMLSAYAGRAAEAIVAKIRAAQQAYVPRPRFEGAVTLQPFTKVRESRPRVEPTPLGPFARGVGYAGFRKSLYPHDWFDSDSAERQLGLMLDDAPEVTVWLRLQRSDLPLPWRSTGEEYHPDFVVVESDGTHWVIEGKRDADIERADVLAKRAAAIRWANYVTTATGETWRYLFASETDIRAARGSWEALRQLAGER